MKITVEFKPLNGEVSLNSSPQAMIRFELISGLAHFSFLSAQDIHYVYLMEKASCITMK